jgi:hypothetical protein
MGLMENDCDDGRRMAQGSIQKTVPILLLLSIPVLLELLFLSPLQIRDLKFISWLLYLGSHSMKVI